MFRKAAEKLQETARSNVPEYHLLHREYAMIVFTQIHKEVNNEWLGLGVWKQDEIEKSWARTIKATHMQLSGEMSRMAVNHNFEERDPKVTWQLSRFHQSDHPNFQLTSQLLEYVSEALSKGKWEETEEREYWRKEYKLPRTSGKDITQLKDKIPAVVVGSEAELEQEMGVAEGTTYMLIPLHQWYHYPDVMASPDVIILGCKNKCLIINMQQIPH